MQSRNFPLACVLDVMNYSSSAFCEAGNVLVFHNSLIHLLESQWAVSVENVTICSTVPKQIYFKNFWWGELIFKLNLEIASLPYKIKNLYSSTIFLFSFFFSLYIFSLFLSSSFGHAAPKASILLLRVLLICEVPSLQSRAPYFLICCSLVLLVQQLGTQGLLKQVYFFSLTVWVL